MDSKESVGPVAVAPPEGVASGGGHPAAPAGKAKVSIGGLGRSRDAELIAAANRILAGVTGNPVYPAPVPALVDVGAARDAFVAAVSAFDGGRKSVAVRNQARAALLAMLRELALYVQQRCQGNLVKLLASGYSAQRVRGQGATEPLLPPEALQVRQGRASGQVEVRCAAVPSARVYQFRYATAQMPTVWTLTDATSKSQCRVDGLVPGTVYSVQARVYGKRGTSDWSDAVTLMVV